MPVIERNARDRPPLNQTRHRLNTTLHDRLIPMLFSELGVVGADEWKISQIGRTWWVVDVSGAPMFALGKTAETALSNLKGIVHGLSFERTLAKHGLNESSSIGPWRGGL